MIIDATVCSGFPVQLRITDVELPRPDFDDEPGHSGRVHYELLTMRGEPATFLQLSDADRDRLDQLAWDHAFDP